MSFRIEGETIYLQELTEMNATEKYCNWLNDPIVNKYLETRQATVTGLREYIKKHQRDPNSFLVGIFDKRTDEHIGNMKLEPINFSEKTANFGILIGNKNYWGKGIGTIATKLLVDYAFDKIGLSEIILGVVSGNKSAVRVYEKVGFKVFDIKKSAKKYNDKFFDQIMMSIIKKNE